MSGALCIPSPDTRNEYWTSQLCTDHGHIVASSFMRTSDAQTQLTKRYGFLRVWWLRGLDSERLSLVGGFFLMFSILCQGCCNLSLYHRERWGSLWCPGWYLFLGIELVILGWLCSSRHLPKLEHQQKQQHRRLDRTSQPLLQGDYRRHDQFRNGLMVWLCFDGLPQSKLQAFPGLPKRDPPVPGRP